MTIEIIQNLLMLIRYASVVIACEALDCRMMALTRDGIAECPQR